MDYFPLSLPGLANVTTFNVTLTLNQIDFADVLKDLSRMSALEDFTLKLCRPRDNIFNDAVQLYEKTELPSIRRLNLEVEVYYGLLAPLRKALPFFVLVLSWSR